MQECQSRAQPARPIGPAKHIKTVPANACRNSLSDALWIRIPDRMTRQNDCAQTPLAGGANAFGLAPFDDVFLCDVLAEVTFDIAGVNRGGEPGSRFRNATVRLRHDEERLTRQGVAFG